MAPKIIFTVTNDLNYDQRMIRICTALAKEGYQVCLLGRQKKDSKALLEKPYQQHRLSCFFEKGKFFYLEFNLRLFLYLLFKSFDAICAIDLDTVLPAFLTSRLKRKICIYDAHEYFTETPEVVRRSAIQKVWEGVANFTVPKLQLCYTVGPALAAIFEKRYGVPFSVIRNMPSYRESAISYQLSAISMQQAAISRQSSIVLLYQGALNEGRGLEQIIKTMLHLPGCNLWLVGEGDLSDQLRELVYSQNLEKQVKFWGLVQPQELWSITTQATIGLNLLINNSESYYYSLANKAFDYVQAGLPSINMNFPEYQQLNEQYEVFSLIDNLDPTTLQKAVIKLLEDHDYYEKLRSNCLVAREVWNWENEKQTLIKFYQNCFMDKLD